MSIQQPCRFTVALLVAIMLLLTWPGSTSAAIPIDNEIRVVDQLSPRVDGKYDQAIAEYCQLGDLGQIDKMQDKIAQAEEEKQAALNLEKGQELLEKGSVTEALQVLESIPGHTRAGRKAGKIITAINKGEF